ncbi:MAG: gamma-glutamyl-gamma-aminobutyrate hydrolase family protein [Streptococcus sp.]
MNVALGGSSTKTSSIIGKHKPSDYLYHEMVIEEHSKLAEIYGCETSINSFHHQSIKHLALTFVSLRVTPKITLKLLSQTRQTFAS